jgi:molecular chaperone DnaK
MPLISKGSEKSEMETAIENISQASHKLAEVLYAAQSATGEAPSEEGPAAEGGGGDGDDDIVDAEYTDQ